MITKMQALKNNRLQFGSLVLALALLVAAIVAAVNGGGAANLNSAAPQEPDPGPRSYALLAGIPQHGPVLGYRRAPVTLQFFGDLQCRHSREVALGALPFLIRRFVRAGKLRIRFRSTETDTNQAGGWYEFREQQTAALAAGKQGKLWNFIDVFYRKQGPEFTGYANDAFLHRIAVDAGLDMQRWSRDRPPVREVGIDLIDADEALAAIHNLRSTPSFLIGRTGGPARPVRHFSLGEPNVFESAVEKLL